MWLESEDSTMKKLLLAALRKLGTNKGAPRLYLDHAVQERAGFVPGVTFSVERYDDRNAVVIRLAKNGTRAVVKKNRAGRDMPVIDLNSIKDLGLFEGMEQVRVLFGEGEIWVLPVAREVRKQARIRRLKEELAAGIVSTGAIAHGAGVMTNALHRGMKDAGLMPEMRFAIEIEDDSLEQAMLRNEAYSADTFGIAMPMQEVAFADDYVRARLEPVSVLEAGVPCTAASVAGRAKKKLARPEDDAKAGHLVLALMTLISRVNPFSVLIENVGPWHSSPSAAMLRTQLRELGYEVQEITLQGEDYAVEARMRKVLVAVTEGASIDFSAFLAPPREVQTVGDILDPVAADAPCWSEMGYLKEKELRDIADGKGFRMAIAKPSDTTVGTLGTGYGKCRGTEAKVAHPTNPDLLRQFTPVEHARIKGVPLHLIDGITSATRAHAMLGQSVIWPAFRHLGEYFGTWLATALQDANQNTRPADLFAAA